MIKLSRMILCLLLSSCLLVTLATARIFFNYSQQLEKNEVLLQGRAVLNQVRQKFDFLIGSIEEKQELIRSFVSDYQSKEQWEEQLQNVLESAFLDSNSIHFELLFVADSDKNINLNLSTHSAGHPDLLTLIATKIRFVNGFSRVIWSYDSGVSHEFLVSRRKLHNRLDSTENWFYAGIRFSGKSGFLESIRRSIDAEFLVITDKAHKPTMVSDRPIDSYSLAHNEHGLVSGTLNGSKILMVVENIGLHGVFSGSSVAITAPESSVRYLSASLEKSYRSLLVVLLVYVAITFYIVRSMVSKSMSQVLRATHQFVDNDKAELDKVDCKTNINEFSLLLQDFSVLASRLKDTANKHKRAEKTAVAQTELLSKNKQELEEQNQQLSRLNEQMEQFVYSTSHDLKSPLTLINGLAQFALLDLSSGNHEEVKENVEKIQGLSVSLSSMIEDLLEVIKIDHVTLKKVPLDLKAIVGSIWDELPAGPHGEVELHCEYQHEDPIMANEVLVSGMLTQLLGNAVKFSGVSREVRFVLLKTGIADGVFELAICDNGVGIPAQYHDKIFKMFQQFDRQGLPGSGLGLSLVKKYAEKSGGDVSFKPLDPGVEFCVRWPL